MEIQTKYSNDDIVWLIVQQKGKQFISCSFCLGTGNIKGNDGTERTCPDCYGHKGKTEWLDIKWQVKGPLTIGRTGVEITGESKGFDPDSIFDNYGPQKYGYKEEYMCQETGIGSGKLYEVECLFPSREEAQNECNKRNNKEVANAENQRNEK